MGPILKEASPFVQRRAAVSPSEAHPAFVAENIPQLWQGLQPSYRPCALL